MKEIKCTSGTLNTLQSQPDTVDEAATQMPVDTLAEQSVPGLSIPVEKSQDSASTTSAQLPAAGRLGLRSGNLKVASLLAMAAMSLASSGVSIGLPARQVCSRRGEHESELARQKRIAMQRLNKDQQAWNDAVDAKQALKKRGKP